MTARSYDRAGSYERAYHIPSYERTELSELSIDSYLEASSSFQDVYETLTNVAQVAFDQDLPQVAFAMLVIADALAGAFGSLSYTLVQANVIGEEHLDADEERMTLRRDANDWGESDLS